MAEDSAAVYFLKRLPCYLSINRTVVAVREYKQNTTYCRAVEQLFYVCLTDVKRLANKHYKQMVLLQETL